MARRPSLSGDPLPKQRETIPEPVLKMSLAKRLRAPSRRDARAVTIWIPQEAKEQLRTMVFELRIPEQRLGEEALNDLFAKYGKHRLATAKRDE